MRLECGIEKKLGDFSLQLQMDTQAERIGILGASGCGKSLTLKSIAGIETPDRGRICLGDRLFFDSEERKNLKPQQRKVGYLFQNYALFPTMTTAENIGVALKGSREEKRLRVRELLQRFRLEGLEDRLPRELSGGQQQRTALARIMAYEPRILLLDEPFSALDAHLREQMYQEMMGLLEDYDGTVILVSHSRDEIFQFSRQLFILDKGKIVRQGDTREVFANPGNRVSAGLTGCKNISAARKAGEYQIYASDWKLLLKSEQKVPDTLRYVGIRAHDLEPSDQMRENCLPCTLSSVREAPFEVLYLMTGPQGGSPVWWKMAKNRIDENASGAVWESVPKYLYFPPSRLLLLEE